MLSLSKQLLSSIRKPFATNKQANDPNWKRLDKLKKVPFFDESLKFPLHIPIKHRYVYSPTKRFHIPQSKKIEFNRLNGNEILLVLENLSKLKKQDVLVSLERLAEQPGQEKFNWREHAWVNAAFEDIKTNVTKYKKSWGLRFYKLMRKLRNEDPEMWKIIYQLIYETLHELPIADFIYFWEKYQKDQVNVDEKFREDLFKLMELRLRSFPPKSILKAYHTLQEFGRINHYWIENVFVPLFKSQAYNYKPLEIAQIIKILIFLGHEKNPRFYEAFYPRILKLKFTNQKEINGVKQALQEAQDIFKTHRLQPYMNYIQSVKVEAVEVVALPKKKELAEIVQQDILYYRTQLKIKNEQLNNPSTSTSSSTVLQTVKS